MTYTQTELSGLDSRHVSSRSFRCKSAHDFISAELMKLTSANYDDIVRLGSCRKPTETNVPLSCSDDVL